jgi:hypothetical protein
MDLRLWLNLIAEGNNKMPEYLSDCITEADNLYSQNSISDIIAAHLKILPFEKNYSKQGDPRREIIGIVNPFVEQKETDSTFS